MIKDSMPYLFFDRNCSDALAFYEKVLGAKVNEKHAYSTMGFPVPDADKDLVAHSSFTFANKTFLAADFFAMGADSKLAKGNNVSIFLEVEGLDAFEKLCQAFEKGGAQTLMPPFDSPWGSKYTKLVDPFGMIFELNCQLS